MKKGSFFNLTAWFLACAMLLGGPYLTASFANETPKDASNPLFSAKLGAIEQIHQGRAGQPTVYYILDAHSISSAQRAIQQIIAEIEANKSVSLVALEGASGPLDVDLLRAFGDREKLKTVLWTYVESGELSGAEVQSAIGPPASYRGIEDRKLYEKNLLAFRSAQRQFRAAKNSLSGVRKKLEAIASETFDPKLGQLLEIDKSIGEDGTLLLEYLKRLRSFGLEASEVYPHLSRMLAVLEKDELSVQDEDLNRRLNVWLKNRLNKIKAAQSLKHQYETGQVSTAEAVRTITPWINQDLLPEEERELIGRVASREEIASIRGVAAMKELKAWLREKEDRLVEGGSSSEALLAKIRTFERLEKFLSLEITLEEWIEIRKNMAHLESGAYREYLKAHGYEEAVAWDISPAFRFYELAGQRDAALAQNLNSILEKMNGDESAILVTGGFHQNGITDYLKKEGYSYCVISPFFTKSGVSPYREVLEKQADYLSNAVATLPPDVSFSKTSPFWKKRLEGIASRLLPDPSSAQYERGVLSWANELLTDQRLGLTETDISDSLSVLSALLSEKRLVIAKSLGTSGSQADDGDKNNIIRVSSKASDSAVIRSTPDILNTRSVMQDLYNFLHVSVTDPAYGFGRAIVFMLDANGINLEGKIGVETAQVTASLSREGSVKEEDKEIQLEKAYEDWKRRGRNKNLTVFETTVKKMSFLLPKDTSEFTAALKDRETKHVQVVPSQDNPDVIANHFSKNNITPIPQEYFLLPIIHDNAPIGVVYVDDLSSAGSLEPVDPARIRRLQSFIASLAKSIDLSAEFERIIYDLTHDSLTQAWNRRGAEDKFPEVLENILLNEQAISIAVGDIDNLKIVNDTKGHRSGDEYIKSVLNTISSNSGWRWKDMIVRPHGDEFILILPERDMHQAWELVENCRKSVAEKNMSDILQKKVSKDIKPSFTAGLVTYKAVKVTYKYVALVPNYHLDQMTEIIESIGAELASQRKIELGARTIEITNPKSKFRGSTHTYFLFGIGDNSSVSLEKQIMQASNQIFNLLFEEADTALYVGKDRRNTLQNFNDAVKKTYSIKRFDEEMLRKTRVTAQEEFRQNPFPAHKLNKKGEILDVSDKWLELLGYTRAEVLGKEIFEFMPKEDQQVARANHLQRMKRYDELQQLGVKPSQEGYQNLNLTRQYVHKNGHRITVSSTHQINFDLTTGEILGVTSYILDARQTKFLQSRARLGMDEAAFGNEGFIFHISQGISTRLGYTDADVLMGSRILNLFAEADQARVKKIIEMRDKVVDEKVPVLMKGAKGELVKFKIFKPVSQDPSITYFILEPPAKGKSLGQMQRGLLRSEAEFSLLRKRLTAGSENDDLLAAQFFLSTGVSRESLEEEAARFLAQKNVAPLFFGEKIDIPRQSSFMALDLDSISLDARTLARISEFAGENGRIYPFYTNPEAFEKFRVLRGQIPVELQAKWLKARPIKTLDAKSLFDLRKRSGLGSAPVNLLISKADLMSGDFSILRSSGGREPLAFQFDLRSNDPTLAKAVYSMIFDAFGKNSKDFLLFDKSEVRAGIMVYSFDLLQLAEALTAEWSARSALLKAA